MRRKIVLGFVPPAEVGEEVTAHAFEVLKKIAEMPFEEAIIFADENAELIEKMLMWKGYRVLTLAMKRQPKMREIVLELVKGLKGDKEALKEAIEWLTGEFEIERGSANYKEQLTRAWAKLLMAYLDNLLLFVITILVLANIDKLDEVVTLTMSGFDQHATN